MLSFVDFVKKLGVKLSPAQQVFACVAFDGVQPRDLDDADRAIARQLFEDVDEVPEAARKVISLVKGARVGGTWLCALRGVHLALHVDLAHLAPGERAFVGITGPSKKLARQALRYALGAVESKPALRKLLLGTPSTDNFAIKRPDGRVVEFQIQAVSIRGAEQRGAWLVFFHLVEASFLRDPDTGACNDRDAFKAARPRLLKGGQLVLESTAWLTESLHWQLYEANLGNPTTALSCLAPTVLMRSDDPEVLEHVAQEYARDPDEADCEFGGKPQPTGSTHWFDVESIKSCTMLGTALVLPDPESRSCFAAGDAGFRRDASTLCIVHRDNDQLVVVDTLELRPTKGNPLRPSEVVAAWADMLTRYGCTSVACDLHYVESLREHLESHKLYLDELPAGQQGKVDQYLATRNAMREGRLRLPNDERLQRQLRDVVYRATSGGGLDISSPRRGYGSHGDLVASLVGAVYVAHRNAGGLTVPPTEVKSESTIWGSDGPGW